MAISCKFWLGNLLAATAQIADEEAQVRRWLAADARAWERPVELLLTLEDLNLELFIEEHRNRFSEPQLTAASELDAAAVQFNCGPNGWRSPHEVLLDPAWEEVRRRARAFISAFESGAQPSSAEE